MGKHGFLCVDCHTAPDHQLRGRAFSVSVEDAHGVACTDCHQARSTRTPGINGHLRSVACQTCHIPTFARTHPTKATWDWSKAGDTDSRGRPAPLPEDQGRVRLRAGRRPRVPLVQHDRRPLPGRRRHRPRRRSRPSTCRGATSRTGTRASGPSRSTGPCSRTTRSTSTCSRRSRAARAGTGRRSTGTSAFQLGAEAVRARLTAAGTASPRRRCTGPSRTWWRPRSKALGCTDCHGDKRRMDWKALGYSGDPITDRRPAVKTVVALAGAPGGAVRHASGWPTPSSRSTPSTRRSPRWTRRRQACASGRRRVRPQDLRRLPRRGVHHGAQRARDRRPAATCLDCHVDGATLPVDAAHLDAEGQASSATTCASASQRRPTAPVATALIAGKDAPVHVAR